jgi:hypothetical protein
MLTDVEPTFAPNPIALAVSVATFVLSVIVIVIVWVARALWRRR